MFNDWCALFNHALELLCGIENFAWCIQVHNYPFVFGEGVQFCLSLKMFTNCLSNKHVLRVKSWWRCLGSLWRCWAFMGVFGVFSDFLLVLLVWSELPSCTCSSLWSSIIQSPLQVSRFCSLLQLFSVVFLCYFECECMLLLGFF